ncbi:aldose epimerase [Pseudalkalibacillus hwajinpoensis]|uniref:aldose epimerase family protein n=1 Tax=Guptibacillus hwajinpoensis TaxID=208199 RepID=UPI001CFE8AEF|nr:aldose epimerase [Pseudalkalibacillus hwajinpoensis]
MYEIKQSVMDGYTIYQLFNCETNSVVRIAPERGGMVAGYKSEGEELLYLNEETFSDSESNVRGGIPVLFPICGELEEKQYRLNGVTYTMKNHGFARNLPWDVVETSTEDGAQLTLQLKSKRETKKSFPFDFELRFTYILKNNELIIKQSYSNHSSEIMPFYAGFHPYFHSEDKNLVYQADAKDYFDYNDGEVKPFHGEVNLTEKREAVALKHVDKHQIKFDLKQMNQRITISYGSEFKYAVLWTEQNKGFVCIEPWMAKMNDFNEKEDLQFVKPGETMNTFVTIGTETICESR